MHINLQHCTEQNSCSNILPRCVAKILRFYFSSSIMIHILRCKTIVVSDFSVSELQHVRPCATHVHSACLSRLSRRALPSVLKSSVSLFQQNVSQGALHLCLGITDMSTFSPLILSSFVVIRLSLHGLVLSMYQLLELVRCRKGEHPAPSKGMLMLRLSPSSIPHGVLQLPIAPRQAHV